MCKLFVCLGWCDDLEVFVFVVFELISLVVMMFLGVSVLSFSSG